MIDWIIHPRKSVGPIRFGIGLDEIEVILGIDWKSFRQTKLNTRDILSFDKESLHLFLNDDYKLIQISVFKPNSAYLMGIQLLGRPLKDIADELSRKSIDHQPVEAGMWIEKERIVLVEVEDVVDGVEVLE